MANSKEIHVSYLHETRMLEDYNNDYVFGVGKHMLKHFIEEKEIEIEILKEIEIGYSYKTNDEIKDNDIVICDIQDHGKHVEDDSATAQFHTRKQFFIVGEVKPIEKEIVVDNSAYIEWLDKWEES